MFRMLFMFITTLSISTVARAHFIFIIPDSEKSSKITVIFSDDLEVDEGISVERLKGLKLTGKFEGNREAPVECKEGKGCLIGVLGLVNPQCVYGTYHYGVLQKANSKPYLLLYHAKAVLANANPKFSTLGSKVVPIELIPIMVGKEVKFQFLANSKPVAEAKITIIKPGGGKTKIKTNDEGVTTALPAQGRYGAWARYIEVRPGECGGKKYEEVRHYATLVVDLTSK